MAFITFIFRLTSDKLEAIKEPTTTTTSSTTDNDNDNENDNEKETTNNLDLEKDENEKLDEEEKSDDDKTEKLPNNSHTLGITLYPTLSFSLEVKLLSFCLLTSYFFRSWRVWVGYSPNADLPQD